MGAPTRQDMMPVIAASLLGSGPARDDARHDASAPRDASRSPAAVLRTPERSAAEPVAGRTASAQATPPLRNATATARDSLSRPELIREAAARSLSRSFGSLKLRLKDATSRTPARHGADAAADGRAHVATPPSSSAAAKRVMAIANLTQPMTPAPPSDVFASPGRNARRRPAAAEDEAVQPSTRKLRRAAAPSDVEDRILSITDEQLTFRYEFEHELGHGNWGSCWRAIPESTLQVYRETPAKRGYVRPRVAVKFVERTPDAASHARTKALWNEFKILRSTGPRDHVHRNIVRFHEFLLTPSFACLAMEWYEQEMKVGLPPSEYAGPHGYCAQLASAVAWLHERSVVHCDIKVANVLVKRSEARSEAILVDFGFARLHTPESRFLSSELWGTPEYLSPERARGDEHDERLADVWALGVTFFEMVVGRTPFEDDDDEPFDLSQEQIHAYYQRTLTDTWADTCTKLSPLMLDLCRRMLAPEPGVRMTSGACLVHPFFDEPAPLTEQFYERGGLNASLVNLLRAGAPVDTPSQHTVVAAHGRPGDAKGPAASKADAAHNDEAPHHDEGPALAKPQPDSGTGAGSPAPVEQGTTDAPWLVLPDLRTAPAILPPDEPARASLEALDDPSLEVLTPLDSHEPAAARRFDATSKRGSQARPKPEPLEQIGAAQRKSSDHRHLPVALASPRELSAATTVGKANGTTTPTLKQPASPARHPADLDTPVRVSAEVLQRNVVRPSNSSTASARSGADISALALDGRQGTGTRLSSSHDDRLGNDSEDHSDLLSSRSDSTGQYEFNARHSAKPPPPPSQRRPISASFGLTSTATTRSGTRSEAVTRLDTIGASPQRPLDAVHHAPLGHIGRTLDEMGRLASRFASLVEELRGLLAVPPSTTAASAHDSTLDCAELVASRCSEIVQSSSVALSRASSNTLDHFACANSPVAFRSSRAESHELERSASDDDVASPPADESVASSSSVPFPSRHTPRHGAPVAAREHVRHVSLGGVQHATVAEPGEQYVTRTQDNVDRAKHLGHRANRSDGQLLHTAGPADNRNDVDAQLAAYGHPVGANLTRSRTQVNVPAPSAARPQTAESVYSAYLSENQVERRGKGFQNAAPASASKVDKRRSFARISSLARIDRPLEERAQHPPAAGSATPVTPAPARGALWKILRGVGVGRTVQRTV